MSWRYQQKIYHANVNASLMVVHLTGIRIGIVINVSVSAKIQENIIAW